MAATAATKTTAKRAAKDAAHVDAMELSRALRLAAKYAGRRSAIQALAGVRIHGIGKDLVLETTDMEAHARHFVLAEMQGKLDVLLPIKDLQTALKGYKAGDVITLRPAGEGQVAVAHDTRHVTLTELRMDDFPRRQYPAAGNVAIHARGSELEAIVKGAATFAADDETRPILTGVLVDTEKRALVATNSYFLGHFAMPGKVSERPAANIPARPLTMALHGLSDEEGVILEIHDQYAVVRRSGSVVMMRLIDGEFPRWEQLVPPEESYSLTVSADAERLLEVVGAAGDVAASGRASVIQVTVEVDQLVIEANVADGAHMRDVVAADVEVHEGAKDTVVVKPKGKQAKPAVGDPPAVRTALEVAQSISAGKTAFKTKAAAEKAAAAATAKTNGRVVFTAGGTEGDWSIQSPFPMRIGLNPRFLGDAIDALDGETMRLKFISPLRPCVLEGSDGDWALLMPIRLGVS